MSLSAVVLAGGQGKRMQSSLPKVLHTLAGKTLLAHVLATTQKLPLTQKPFIVYGFQGQAVKNALSNVDVTWVHQARQLGTGHALQQALPFIDTQTQVLILYGDVPLISHETLEKLCLIAPKDGIGMITATLDNPTGLGRIIRDAQQKITRIIEERDASSEVARIQEINTGIYLIAGQLLQKYLPLLQNLNEQKEFYLTDVIALAAKDQVRIESIAVENVHEILGVNTKLQLSFLERYYQLQQTQLLMAKGVTIIDPQRVDIRGEIDIGQDTTLDINVILAGEVKIGKRCYIGPHCIIKDTTIADDVEIRAHSLIEGALIENFCTVGPFARLRPGTQLKAHAHIGNFVELKNSKVAEHSKINHLSYIGDSLVGKGVNIGAGVITCNYDGANKHQTIIEDYAFIGSNAQLIAPITIGEGATIGAGSTITRHAPAHQLTLTRALQKSLPWQRPQKKESV